MFSNGGVVVSSHSFDTTLIQNLGATITTDIVNAFTNGVSLAIIGLLKKNDATPIWFIYHRKTMPHPSGFFTIDMI